MTSIYFGKNVRLKTYSAITKGGKSTIRIDLETTDHFELGHVLRQCDEIEAQQKLAAKPKPATKRPARQLALPAPRLALPYFPEEG